MTSPSERTLTTEECDQVARINAQDSAYAVAGYQTPNGDLIYGAPGLTKREMFAAMAMQGICGDGIPGSHHKHATTAMDAVSYADELLKALAK